jgi:hypothetical protein
VGSLFGAPWRAPTSGRKERCTTGIRLRTPESIGARIGDDAAVVVD